MVFHWSLSDSKSPRMSRTLLSILADLNNVVVWMASTRPLISKSSSPFTNPWVTVPRAPITIGIVIYSLGVSHISDCRWSFTGVWVTTSILTVLNNVIVWIVSPRPPASVSSSPFNNPLVTVPKAPITVGIIVTFMFHSFSISLQGLGTYSSFHILSVLFCGQPGQQNR